MTCVHETVGENDTFPDTSVENIRTEQEKDPAPVYIGGLEGKASDTRARGRGFEPPLGHRVMSLTKAHLPPPPQKKKMF